ncbi:GtrA family protein [Bradyrhizobium sp. 87]|uniref:GtrA family protein n=1 Tax=Bradyrhizobium sp. 87 TaxID=2782682 RepID=UPI001FF990F4|nr:GtrA family protein [Bradyrhizobium sp. 87]MCK1429192.1 GtrA family protein [Bradyrhizobium sp. 87]
MEVPQQVLFFVAIQTSPLIMLGAYNLAGASVKTRFTRFLIVGALAAAVNIVARVLISRSVRFEYAVVLAFPVALTFAFVMSKVYVFQTSQSSGWQQYLRFLLVYLAALVQVWLVSVGLMHWIMPTIGWEHHPELVAHTVAVCSPVLITYYAHKRFTFKQR